jgi:hypothetical protein
MCSTDAFIAASSIRFFNHRLQTFLVQVQIGHQLAQPGVFIPQSLGLLRLAHIHAAILRLPGVDRMLGDPTLPGYIFFPPACLQLLQRRDHLPSVCLLFDILPLPI